MRPQLRPVLFCGYYLYWEYTVESKRVDFSLRINGTNKVFIEVKRPNENLETHQEQLLGYSFREGVKQAILTNGITWWFYLPLNEGSWQQRRFFTADFLQQDPNAIAEKLIGLLSRKNSASGDTLKNAEHLYRGRQTRNILRDALPKAWYKILNDPDDQLVELLIETTEKLSGFRPEIEDVEKFIINIQTSPSTKSEVSSSPIKQAISPVSARKPISYPEGSFINKQVRSFSYLVILIIHARGKNCLLSSRKRCIGGTPLNFPGASRFVVLECHILANS